MKLNKGQIAMLKYLLTGSAISNINILSHFGYTNCSREIRRKIEIPLELYLERKKVKKTSRYGEPFWAFNYTLKPEDRNKVQHILIKNKVL